MNTEQALQGCSQDWEWISSADRGHSGAWRTLHTCKSLEASLTINTPLSTSVQRTCLHKLLLGWLQHTNEEWKIWLQFPGPCPSPCLSLLGKSYFDTCREQTIYIKFCIVLVRIAGLPYCLKNLPFIWISPSFPKEMRFWLAPVLLFLILLLDCN